VTLFNGASVGQSDQFLVGPLALQGGRIYFVVNGTLSYTARVYSCPTTGCDFTGVPVPVGIPAPPGYGLGFGVATDTTSVYWGTYDTIYACPLSGCNGSPTTVATGLFAQDPLRGLAQSGGYLYFTSQYSVETCPVAGGCDCTGMGSCATGASEGVSATAIAARPGGVYATFASAGAVVALGTGRTPVLPFAAARGVGDVATDGDHVYFTSQEANGSISACALDSCDGGPSVIASNLGTLGALAVDATRVYVVVGVSAGTGTSFGLATNNGNAIVAVAK
jgi:hypothetical protein